MKKSFFGYSVQEVDETIDYLESHNIRLEKQVRQLSADLDEANAKLSEMADLSDIKKINAENEEKIKTLDEEIASLKNEISDLKSQNMSLTNELSQKSDVQEDSDSYAYDKVGSICRRAYEDMSNAKAEVRRSIEEFLESFWKEWHLHQERLHNLSSELKKQQEENRNYFLAKADNMLKIHEDLEKEHIRFASELDGDTGIETEIKTAISRVLNDLSKPDAKENARSERESDKDDFDDYAQQVGTNAILRAIEEAKQKKELPGQQFSADAESEYKIEEKSSSENITHDDGGDHSPVSFDSISSVNAFRDIV